MIFVTVGTAGQGMEFPRLVHEMDRVAGVLGQDVLIQLGTYEYRPQHARAVRFLSFAEALRMFREADLVVAHCGAGTVLNALSCGKPTVVVPRRVEAREHDRDDHQMQLAAKLAGMEGVRVVYDVRELEGAIRSLLASGVRPHLGEGRCQLIEAVRRFLDGLDQPKTRLGEP
jgi:UDP-N-acetylglucosamine transferase subunit ALG13